MGSELDELKKRKLEEFQRAFSNQQGQDDEIRQQVQEIEGFVKAHLSREALERYSNLKLAFPERAMSLLGMLATAIQNYKIKEISDAQLRELLQRLQPKEKDFNLKFERK